MMATRPSLPADEEPLDAATVDLLLSNLGTDMVLVGGQALAFWMDRYGIGSGGADISNDGDVLGNVGRAHDLAEALRARLIVPPATARTAIVGQIRLPTDEGKARNIDVLHKLFTNSGLRKSSEFTKRVIQDAVEVEWRRGKFIRVMDPFDVLQSRVENAVGLIDDKGLHVLTQAVWAIAVARAALLKLASHPQVGDRLGKRIQSIYGLATSQVGKRLLDEHDIEVLDAVDVDALRAIAPSHDRQLDNVQSARLKRQGKRSKRSKP
ncbi:hypothetical protein WKW79_07680 [Variovorax robiniae]|uniref:Uncharacterized protein n=1 Tax=Variovorax robiniae TaxID=1836199 RepID=A0ABU8X3S0_9BURK